MLNFDMSDWAFVCMVIYLVIGYIIASKYIKIKWENCIDCYTDCEGGAYNLYTLFLTFIWPITLYKYIQMKNGKQISRSEDKY